jgi:hypothetical protein
MRGFDTSLGPVLAITWWGIGIEAAHRCCAPTELGCAPNPGIGPLARDI